MYAAQGIMILSVIVLTAATVLGICAFLFKKAPLYFRILTLATICYTGIWVFRLIYYICFDIDFEGMGITFFGYFGCYLFLFSANFGQYDSFIDDRNPQYQKYRIIALLAPIFVLALLVCYTVGNPENATHLIVGTTVIGYLPAVFSSYYNLKHFIIPDMGFSLVRWVRLTNLCALLIEAIDIVRIAFAPNFDRWIDALLLLFISILFLAMLLFAEKGRKSWLR